MVLKNAKSFFILNKDENESLFSFMNIITKTIDATKYDKQVE